MLYARTALLVCYFVFFCVKQKTAYELRISDWVSDVCSSDLDGDAGRCAKSSKPFSICYGQDVPGGFCPTVFRHGARYTSGSAPCATMGYSKASIIISFGSIASGQGENQHHPRQSSTARA